MEFAKVVRLPSVRFTLVLLILVPFLWAYAPGIYDVYGFFLISGYQVPALGLLSGMEFLLPLLVAITSAELLGIEMTYGTLPTVLLRPVTRAKWLAAKLVVAAAYPFMVLSFFLVISLLVGAPHGYGSFVGGTGLGSGGLLGEGVMQPLAALAQLFRAYLIAGISLIPIGLLAMLFTVVFMSAAGGALATLSTLIIMQLLVVFPWLEPYLLTAHLSAYSAPVGNLGWVITLIIFYCMLFAALAVVLFERKDF